MTAQINESMSEEAQARINQRIQDRAIRQKELEERRAEENKNKYVKLEDGQTIVLKFEVEKDAPRKEFANKFGGTSKKTFYPVIDPNTGEDKVFSANDQTAEVIDTFLNKRHIMLEIKRKGVKTDTQYIVTPA